ncbi:MAG: hypothetical protein HND47_14240 [Chloroflexi bacterium]|nr:hypothetical protein [Chloroflexota bacterium]
MKRLILLTVLLLTACRQEITTELDGPNPSAAYARKHAHGNSHSDFAVSDHNADPDANPD